MIAFELFGRPVYWYGLFYLITFVLGYLFLFWLPRSSFFARHRNEFQGLYFALKDDLDDIFIVIMLGVVLGGRLGHVFFYEWGHYSQHLLDIVKIHQGGMSFVGGFIGVCVGLIYLYRKFLFSKKEFLLFGDLLLLIVPLGSLLGRFANSLNQELIGKPISELPQQLATFFESLRLTRVYEAVDELTRIDTNILQSLGEGALLFCFMRFLFLKDYRHTQELHPGLLAGSYLIGYGIIRFLIEYLKDLPLHEMIGSVSVSQILAGCMILGGIALLVYRQKGMRTMR